MASRLRQEHRKAEFKKTSDADEGRLKRETRAVELRKQRNIDHLQKRRKDDGGAESAHMPRDPEAEVRARLPPIVAALTGGAPGDRLRTIKALRSMLAVAPYPGASEAIGAGLLPVVLEMLRETGDVGTLRIEAAWTIANIAAGSAEDVRALVDNNAVAYMVPLLQLDDLDLCEQAIFALGNIAGDSVGMRNAVLDGGGMPAILHVLTSSTNPDVTHNAMWALSNFCRGRPTPPLDLIALALPVLGRLLFADDAALLAHACWTLSFVSAGDGAVVDALLNEGGCVRLVQLLGHYEPSVQLPAVRTLGNVTAGSDEQTQATVDAGAVPALAVLLRSDRTSIIKEACWMISNITAGTIAQVQTVVEAGIAGVLLQIIPTANFELKREAVFAAVNIIMCGSDAHVAFMLNGGCIPVILAAMDTTDATVVQVVLEGLQRLLQLGSKEATPEGGNPAVNMIDACDGIDRLTALRDHPNPDVSSLSSRIVDMFFDSVGDDAADIAPAGTGAQYEFGLPALTAASTGPGSGSVVHGAFDFGAVQTTGPGGDSMNE